MHLRAGLQTAVLRLDGPPVAMAAQEHQLAVVWQAGAGAGQVTPTLSVCPALDRLALAILGSGMPLTNSALMKQSSSHNLSRCMGFAARALRPTAQSLSSPQHRLEPQHGAGRLCDTVLLCVRRAGAAKIVLWDSAADAWDAADMVRTWRAPGHVPYAGHRVAWAHAHGEPCREA